jgi:hypothetical protein
MKMDKIMSVTWTTKYGVRRVRVTPPPTLDDALFAAEGLTPSLEQQVQIAAGLLGMPIEQARLEAKSIVGRTNAVPPTSSRLRGTNAPVVVVRKMPRRPVTTRR